MEEQHPREVGQTEQCFDIRPICSQELCSHSGVPRTSPLHGFPLLTPLASTHTCVSQFHISGDQCSTRRNTDCHAVLEKERERWGESEGQRQTQLPSIGSVPRCPPRARAPDLCLPRVWQDPNSQAVTCCLQEGAFAGSGDEELGPKPQPSEVRCRRRKPHHRG